VQRQSAMTETPSPEAGSTTAQPSRRSNKIWVLSSLALLAALAAALWFLISDNASAQRAGEPSRVTFVLHLETFVLNLADADAKAYLRVGIDVGLAHAPAQDRPSPVALVRDTILMVLSRAKAGDVETPEGKEKLKQALLDGLRQRAPDLGVEEIYFTEFLVQR
jgi:flagellar basal body-associated protein FliL